MQKNHRKCLRDRDNIQPLRKTDGKYNICKNIEKADRIFLLAFFIGKEFLFLPVVHHITKGPVEFYGNIISLLVRINLVIERG